MKARAAALRQTGLPTPCETSRALVTEAVELGAPGHHRAQLHCHHHHHHHHHHHPR